MSTDTVLAIFRTPEEVAPELGMTKTELRRYCRISPDHCTRLSNRRIMLDAENIKTIIAYIKAQNRKPVINAETGEEDPWGK